MNGYTFGLLLQSIREYMKVTTVKGKSVIGVSMDTVQYSLLHVYRILVNCILLILLLGCFQVQLSELEAHYASNPGKHISQIVALLDEVSRLREEARSVRRLSTLFFTTSVDWEDPKRV